jgi:hypothetical protein
MDFSKRQVLPLAAAVSTGPLPRFRQRDHARSALVREILDQFNIETERRFAAVPAPERDTDPSESVVMFGNVIENRMTTGSHIVRQRRTVDFATLPELAIAADPFAPVVSTVRTEAAVALAAIINRKPVPRKPAPKRSWIAKLLSR